MFNIEEKLKKWYETHVKVPVVKTENKDDDKEVSVVTVSSKTEKGSVPSKGELKQALEDYQKQMNDLKVEYLYDLEAHKDGKYSDASIEKQASEEVESAYADDYESEAEKNSLKLASIDVARQELEANASKKLADIESNYKATVSNVTDKAIKNGVSRSTIYNGELEKSDYNKSQELLELATENELENKANMLRLENEERRHEKKLQEIDEKKEKSINSKIKELKAERQALIDAGVIPNIVDGDENVITPKMRELRKEIISKTLKYYYSMDKETAKREYEKDVDFQELLGDLEPAIRIYVTRQHIIN